MIIRKYVDQDLSEIIRIWNEVAEEGRESLWTLYITSKQCWKMQSYL